MYEIVGESVKSSIGLALMTAFPEVTWYKEQVSTLKYPHFFLQQITITSSEERKNKWWIDYLVNIRYRETSDPTTDSRIQEKLDAVGLKMLSGLQAIIIGSGILPLRNTRYEKVDGVLQYFCNVKIQATKPRIELPKQLDMEINQILKED